ncbi:MAG TPA: S-layer homology domain-containing protein [Clostridiaceae bacterium]|nr:S-layer homology domain-containing protein [Clostridiaceae bacterium]
MKKIICSIVILTMLLASAPLTVMAVSDAPDLSYKLDIKVLNKDGVESNTFQVGDTIYVYLSFTYTGTGRAPVYGLQGRLHFDPYVIRSQSFSAKNGIQVKEQGRQITFAFLDMSDRGQSDFMFANFCKIVFTAKSNGTVNLYCDNVIVTNYDASHRYVDTSEMVSLVVGTGVKDVTKELLENDIAAAEQMLADCIVTDEPNSRIYYPNFWITTDTEQAFKAAIDQAKAIFDKINVTMEEIEAAVMELAAAVKAFESAKIYGPHRPGGVPAGEGGGGTEVEYYAVKASVHGGNGRIHPDFAEQRCRSNTSCTIRMLPDEGYETEYVYVNGERFDGMEYFTIPRVERDTMVVVTFCKIPPFTDVAREDWFYKSVRYAYNHGLFKGTSETEFSPRLNMTRAMLATVLYRLEGEPEVNASDVFTDVREGMWYTDAITWAHENNIVKGYGNGLFGPDDFVTREQMVVMLHRYAEGKGLTTDESGYELKYTDAPEISGYAVEAMKWAVAKGLIRGTGEGTLSPLGKATRAEVATVLMNYMETFGQEF